MQILQTEGRVARQLATEGFAVVNSRENGAREGNDKQEKPIIKGGLRVVGGVVGGIRGLIIIRLLILTNEIVLPGLTAKHQEISVSGQEKTISNFFLSNGIKRAAEKWQNY